MPTRPRTLLARPRTLLVPLLALVAALLAGCGGGDSPAPAGARTDARELLRDTFSSANRPRSGVVAAQLAVEGHGSAPLAVRITGPFSAEEEGRVPEVQLTASVEEAGRSAQAGLTWTDGKGFVGFQGRQYALPAPLARQFAAGYEEAAAGRAGGGPLGLAPETWLRTPRNVGERQVGGTPTVRVSGDADVQRVVADLQRLAVRARSLLPGGGSGSGALGAGSRERLVRAVRSMRVEVDTGREDRVLRRLAVRARLAPGRHDGPRRADLVVTFTGVGDEQAIAAPQGARPLGELISRVGGLRGLLGR